MSPLCDPGAFLATSLKSAGTSCQTLDQLTKGNCLCTGTAPLMWWWVVCNVHLGGVHVDLLLRGLSSVVDDTECCGGGFLCRLGLFVHF